MRHHETTEPANQYIPTERAVAGGRAYGAFPESAGPIRRANEPPPAGVVGAAIERLDTVSTRYAQAIDRLEDLADRLGLPQVPGQPHLHDQDPQPGQLPALHTQIDILVRRTDRLLDAVARLEQL